MAIHVWEHVALPPTSAIGLSPAMAHVPISALEDSMGRSSRVRIRGLVLALRDAARHFEDFADKAGGEHPILVAVSKVPDVVRLRQRLRVASARLGRGAKDRRLFIAEQDAQLAYRTVREELFFGAGYRLGLDAGQVKRRKLTRPVST